PSRNAPDLHSFPTRRSSDLPRSLARNWLAKKPHESARTQQSRIILVRHFSRFLLRAGYPAYVPESTLAVRKPPTFVPRMFTDEEDRKSTRLNSSHDQISYAV